MTIIQISCSGNESYLDQLILINLIWCQFCIAFFALSIQYYLINGALFLCILVFGHLFKVSV